MNKFTFKLPDRLKLTVEKNGRVRTMTFHAKHELVLKLLVNNVKELLACKDADGCVNLKEHIITITHAQEGVTVDLIEKRGANSLRVHRFNMNNKDFKKFIKVCTEVYCNE